MQVVGCGPFSRSGVRRWQNTKSGAASPPMGETTPLVGAYSIVGVGSVAAPVAAEPRLGRRDSDYRRFTDSFNGPVVGRDSRLFSLRSTSSLFSLIRRLLLTWLAPMEVAPTIGLPQVLPCSGGRAIPPPAGTNLFLPALDHYAHGLTLTRKSWSVGLALDTMSQSKGTGLEITELGKAQLAQGNVQPLNATAQR